MAVLTSVNVTPTATNVAAAAFSATSNTITNDEIGASGALLAVINGAAAPITVTLEDPTFTGVGNAPLEVAQSVTNATTRWFRITRNHVDQSTGLATITLSSITTITYQLIRGA